MQITTEEYAKNPSISASLTGEAAGRQIWHFCPERYQEFETKLIKAFDPSKNPNSSDLLFRSQKIAEWQAKGGKLPDTRHRTRAIEVAQKGPFRLNVLRLACLVAESEDVFANQA